MALPLVRLLFFLMIRRPPRSTLDRSSAASDVYKRQAETINLYLNREPRFYANLAITGGYWRTHGVRINTVSYTHLRAHETVLDLVCRLLLEKKKHK